MTQFCLKIRMEMTFNATQAKLEAVKHELTSFPHVTVDKEDLTLGTLLVTAPDALRPQLEAIPGVVAVLDTSLPVKLIEPVDVTYIQSPDVFTT